MYFQFVGEPAKDGDDADADDRNNPRKTTMFGVTFELNGPPQEIPEPKPEELESDDPDVVKAAKDRAIWIKKLQKHHAFVVCEEPKKRGRPSHKGTEHAAAEEESNTPTVRETW